LMENVIRGIIKTQFNLNHSKALNVIKPKIYYTET